ncbi:UDP-glucose 4-epimerase GalE [Comamonas sp. MYb21]|uniref:UDP-glucose 4-epimerase GalE n=1 Tax=Comamonas sp. MYb21 TaxID=1848648 RepID=UPI0030A6B868
MSGSILVTGGTGFIGSHICIALCDAGFRPLLFDNGSNTQNNVVERIYKITGFTPKYIKGDIRDRRLLDQILRDESIEAVIHLGATRSVSSSLIDPLHCYENNLMGSSILIQAMHNAGIRKLIFSSSAAVYGIPSTCPIPETAPCRPISPYGLAKKMVEQMICDLCLADPEWRAISMRYFNPAGAHISGLMGESRKSKSNQLIPIVSQVALGQRRAFKIFGKDYPTHDGTAIRDYVHVMDLAQAHVLGLKYLQKPSTFLKINLGSGKGHSVLDVVDIMQRVSGKRIEHSFGLRKLGDAPECWADSTFAKKIIGWSAQSSLYTICEDILRWQHSES